MLNENHRVHVTVRIEPPLKWPLWFDNDILDNEEDAPISQELKDEARALELEFVTATDWCNKESCYFWLSADSLSKFRRSAAAFCGKLVIELGPGYEITTPTGALSETGHAFIVDARSQVGNDTAWAPHQCLP